MLLSRKGRLFAEQSGNLYMLCVRLFRVRLRPKATHATPDAQQCFPVSRVRGAGLVSDLTRMYGGASAARVAVCLPRAFTGPDLAGLAAANRKQHSLVQQNCVLIRWPNALQTKKQLPFDRCVDRKPFNV